MKLVDTHSHLTDDSFDADRDAVFQRAESVGVTAIIAVGTTVQSSGEVLELAKLRRQVHAAVGIHPNHASEAGANDWGQIVDLARADRVVAIGETGLDRFRTATPFDVQLDYFERHLVLARERDLPVIIHSRDADSDVVAVLDRLCETGAVRGVMHSFTGNAATAARCIELGLYISFAGQLTFKNRKFDALREVARAVPQDRLLVETDSPYLAPEPHRGERNEPSYVLHTAERLAQIRGVPVAELATLTSTNGRRLFDRMP